MDRISNVDHLILLLRERLAERSRSGSAAPARGRASRAPDLSAAEKVKALAAAEDLDDRQFRRALVQNLLTEQLGGDLVNDAKFQQVVDRVTEALVQDENGAQLMDRLVGDLRGSARG